MLELIDEFKQDPDSIVKILIFRIRIRNPAEEHTEPFYSNIVTVSTANSKINLITGTVRTDSDLDSLFS